MGKLLKLLHGKKTTIAAVVGALVIYSIGRGYIAQDTAELISALLVALGITANVATSKLNK